MIQRIYTTSPVGKQGAPCPMSDQAGHEKHVTGRKQIQLRNGVELITWSVRQLAQLGKFNTIYNEMDKL